MPVKRGIALLFLLVFACLCWTTRYSHPMTDDYCYAHYPAALGSIFGAIEHEYTHWGGRYSAVAMMSSFVTATDLIDGYGFLCLGLIAFSVLAFGAFFASLTAIAGVRRDRYAWSALAFCLYVATLPTVSELFYWMAGGVTYTGGYMSLLVVSGLSLHATFAADRRVPTGLVCAVLAPLILLIAGFNEVAAVLQVLFFTLGTGLLRWNRSRAWRPWAGAALLACVGLLVTALAPGNSVRASLAADGGNLLLTLVSSFLHGSTAMGVGAVIMYLATANVWMAPMTHRAVEGLAESLHKLDAVSRAAIAVGMAGLFWAVFVPVYWATGAYPPNRTLAVLPVLVLVCWLPALALLRAAGWIREVRLPTLTRTHREDIWVACAALLVALLSPNLRELFRDTVRYGPRFARQLEVRDRTIETAKQRGQQEVVVLALGEQPHTLYHGDMGADPDGSRNHCIRLYYGFDSISAISRRAFERLHAASPESD